MPRSARGLPLVAPLCPSSWRERLQKWTSPVSRVSASDSAFMYASVSTSPERQSCTMHGTSPRSSYATCESSISGADSRSEVSSPPRPWKANTMERDRQPHRHPLADRLRRVHERPRNDRGPQYVSSPRGNPAVEQVDLDRGEGKLARVVGN